MEDLREVNLSDWLGKKRLAAYTSVTLNIAQLCKEKGQVLSRCYIVLEERKTSHQDHKRTWVQ